MILNIVKFQNILRGKYFTCNLVVLLNQSSSVMNNASQTFGKMCRTLILILSNLLYIICVWLGGVFQPGWGFPAGVGFFRHNRGGKQMITI